MSLYFYVCQVRSSSLLHVRIIIRRNNEQQSASATTKTAVINTLFQIYSRLCESRKILYYMYRQYNWYRFLSTYEIVLLYCKLEISAGKWEDSALARRLEGQKARLAGLPFSGHQRHFYFLVQIYVFHVRRPTLS